MSLSANRSREDGVLTVGNRVDASRSVDIPDVIVGFESGIDHSYKDCNDFTIQMYALESRYSCDTYFSLVRAGMSYELRVVISINCVLL